MKRITALLLTAVFLLLCGCSGGDVPQESPSPSPTVSVMPSPSPSPSTVPEPEDTPEPTPQFTNPLTGEGVEADISGARPYAIMLNNLKKALPQCGVAQADIIYEMLAEGGITRMVALFQDISDVGAIGSVRSARPYFLDVAEAFDAIYIHAGGSEQAYKDIKSQGITNIDGVNGCYGTGIFYRDAARRASAGYEHSLFTTSDLIQEIIPGLNIRHDHEDGYVCNMTFAAAAAPDGQDATGKITANFTSSKGTGFTYDAAAGLYLVSEYGNKYVDGNTGEQVAVKNVIVMRASYSKVAGDTAGRLKADMSGGTGYFACEGKIAEISWSRDAAGAFVYKLADGTDVTFGIGSTYVCVIDKSSGSVTVE